MPSIPKKIMCWNGRRILRHVGTWATTRYPDNAVPYVPMTDYERVKSSSELGLEMAKANDLWNTAEEIEQALSGQLSN